MVTVKYAKTLIKVLAFGFWNRFSKNNKNIQSDPKHNESECSSSCAGYLKTCSFTDSPI